MALWNFVALPGWDTFHEYSFIIPEEMVPAEDFLDALHGSLKDVTLKWKEFEAAIPEAWENYKSKETEDSIECALMIFQP